MRHGFRRASGRRRYGRQGLRITLLALLSVLMIPVAAAAQEADPAPAPDDVNQPAGDPGQPPPCPEGQTCPEPGQGDQGGQPPPCPDGQTDCPPPEGGPGGDGPGGMCPVEVGADGMCQYEDPLGRYYEVDTGSGQGSVTCPDGTVESVSGMDMQALMSACGMAPPDDMGPGGGPGDGPGGGMPQGCPPEGTIDEATNTCTFTDPGGNTITIDLETGQGTITYPDGSVQEMEMGGQGGPGDGSGGGMPQGCPPEGTIDEATNTCTFTDPGGNTITVDLETGRGTITFPDGSVQEMEMGGQGGQGDGPGSGPGGGPGGCPPEGTIDEEAGTCSFANPDGSMVTVDLSTGKGTITLPDGTVEDFEMGQGGPSGGPGGGMPQGCPPEGTVDEAANTCSFTDPGGNTITIDLETGQGTITFPDGREQAFVMGGPGMGPGSGGGRGEVQGCPPEGTVDEATNTCTFSDPGGNTIRFDLETGQGTITMADGNEAPFDMRGGPGGPGGSGPGCPPEGDINEETNTCTFTDPSGSVITIDMDTGRGTIMKPDGSIQEMRMDMGGGPGGGMPQGCPPNGLHDEEANTCSFTDPGGNTISFSLDTMEGTITYPDGRVDPFNMNEMGGPGGGPGGGMPQGCPPDGTVDEEANTCSFTDPGGNAIVFDLATGAGTVTHADGRIEDFRMQGPQGGPGGPGGFMGGPQACPPDADLDGDICSMLDPAGNRVEMNMETGHLRMFDPEGNEIPMGGGGPGGPGGFGCPPDGTVDDEANTCTFTDPGGNTITVNMETGEGSITLPDGRVEEFRMDGGGPGGPGGGPGGCPPEGTVDEEAGTCTFEDPGGNTISFDMETGEGTITLQNGSVEPFRMGSNNGSGGPQGPGGCPPEGTVVDGICTFTDPGGNIIEVDMASGQGTITSPDGQVRDFDMRSGPGGPDGGPGQMGCPSNVVLNEDGSCTLTNPDGTLTTINPETGEMSHTDRQGRTRSFRQVFNDDGTITTISSDGHTETFDPVSGTRIETMPNGMTCNMSEDFDTGISTRRCSDGGWAKEDRASGRRWGADPNGCEWEEARNENGTISRTSCDGSSGTFDPETGVGTFVDPSGRVVREVRNDDGSVTHTSSDGFASTCNEDTGECTIVEPDGRTGTVKQYSDGRRETTYSDGSVAVWSPDGSREYTGADGCKQMVTKNDDGSLTHSNCDGSSQTTQHLSDGSTRVTFSDGRVATTNPDGSRTLVDADGNTFTEELNADGSITRTRPDGASMIQNPDGSFVLTTADGQIREARRNENGELEVEFDGGQITLAPDGSGTVVTDDGVTVEITVESDGSTVASTDSGEEAGWEPTGDTTLTTADGDTTTRTVNPDGSILTTDEDGTETVWSPDEDLDAAGEATSTAAVVDEAAAALLESVGVEEITSEGGFSTAQASGVSAAIDALAVQLAAVKATEDLRGQATVSSAVFELVLDLEAAVVAATENEDTVGAIVISSLMDDALAVLDG